MNLKKRIDAINNKLNPNPEEEAKQQELKSRIEEARARCEAAGIKHDRLKIKFTPGASIAEMLQEAREVRRAHDAKKVKRVR